MWPEKCSHKESIYEGSNNSKMNGKINQLGYIPLCDKVTSDMI